MIYDWRAPVSGLFYDYDKGPGSYEAPAGLIEGEIAAKWQYKVKKGKMVYAFESDTKIDDDILKQELGTNSDVPLKNIVRTIQKEQSALQQTLENGAVRTNALIGQYPESLDELLSDYHILLDSSRFVIEFVPIGSNLLPSISVIPLTGTNFERRNTAS